MRLLFKLFFLCWGFAMSLAAQSAVDSLERLLALYPPQHHQADTFRIALLCDLAFLLRNQAVMKAATYAQEATTLAKNIDDKRGQARGLGYQGMMAYRQGKYDFAIGYHQASLRLALLVSDSTLISYRYNDLANIYADMGELDQALSYNLQSLHIKELLKDQEGIATAWRNNGIIYLRKKHYPKALEALEKARDLALSIEDWRILGYTYIYLGEWYSEQGQPLEAIRILEQAIALHTQVQNQYGLSEALNSLGLAYLAYDNFEKAKQCFQQALYWAQTLGIPLEIQRAYEGLSRASQQAGLPEDALWFYQKFIQIKDSVFSEANNQRIAYLEAQFQSERKQAQITQLIQERQLQQQALEQERMSKRFFFLGACLALLVLILLVFGIWQKQRSNLLLRTKQEELIAQNEEIQQQKSALEQQAETLERLNSFKDRLFSIIAHDLRAPMATLRGTLNLIDAELLSQEEVRHIKGELYKRFQATDETLHNLLFWVKEQIQSGETLKPEMLRLGVVVSKELNLIAPAVALKKINLLQKIPPEVQVYADPNHLSAIVRNLLNNAVKFSYEGGQISIEAQVKGQQTYLTIKDEGKGMTDEQLQRLFSTEPISTVGTSGEKGSGLGLYLVKSLITQNHGTISVDSHPGQGSTFLLCFPAAPTQEGDLLT